MIQGIKRKKVLISGASMAGLSAALWMNRLGYQVTVIEIAPAPRIAGGAVNIEGPGIEAAQRLGIFEDLKASRLHVERMEFRNAYDAVESIIELTQPGDQLPDDDIEIERDKFVDIHLGRLKENTEFIFNDSITALHETADEIHVEFKHGSPRTFDLVLGCDGIHSGVRRIWFGPEEQYVHFLNGYFSITILPKLLIPEKTVQLYGEPDKGIMLNAYNGKTDIIYTFNSDQELSYDYRNEEEQRNIILSQFASVGWRNAELLEEVKRSGTFYFDKFCQVKMPAWTSGCVALIGDAAFSPSPAAGKGASLALYGATAVADALMEHNGNHILAFPAYDKNLRPYIEQEQARAKLNLEELIPRTEQAIRKRNTEGLLFINPAE